MDDKRTRDFSPRELKTREAIDMTGTGSETVSIKNIMTTPVPGGSFPATVSPFHHGAARMMYALFCLALPQTLATAFTVSVAASATTYYESHYTKRCQEHNKGFRTQ